MRTEVKGEIIWLIAENDQERYLLDVLDKSGIRTTGRSSNSLAICSPHLANLRQLFLNREQQAILAYALGKVESIEMSLSLLGLTQRSAKDMSGAANVIANTLEVLKQLIITEEHPIPPPPKVCPSPPVSTKPLQEKTATP